MTILRANPHQWGNGKIHVFLNENNKTLCGRTLELCAGEIEPGELEDVTCDGCIRSHVVVLKREAENKRHKAEQELYQAEQEKYKRQWWDAYDTYLKSPIWLEKRAIVLRRSGETCEGCRKSKAVQVHHLNYPSGCFPGFPEWIRLEKLFDLVAVCQDCHRDVHARPKAADFFIHKAKGQFVCNNGS